MPLVLLLFLACYPSAPTGPSELGPTESSEATAWRAEHSALSSRVHDALNGGTALRPPATAVTPTAAQRSLQQLVALGVPADMTATFTQGQLTLQRGEERWIFRTPEGQLVPRRLFVRLVEEVLRDQGVPTALLQPRIEQDSVVWALPRTEAEALRSAHPELFEHPALYRRELPDGVELSVTPLPAPDALATRLGVRAESLPQLGEALLGIAKRPDGAHFKGFGVFRWKVTKGHGVKRPDGSVVTPEPVRSLSFQPVGLEAVLKAGAPRPVTLDDPAFTDDMAAVLEAVGAELLAGHGAHIPHLGTFTVLSKPSRAVLDRATREWSVAPASTRVVWLPE